jgi:hypothetical protein
MAFQRLRLPCFAVAKPGFRWRSIQATLLADAVGLRLPSPRRRVMPLLHPDNSPESPDVIDENSMVVLVKAQNNEKGVMPAGARGVVHDAMSDWRAYIVEFSQPFRCVIQVPGTIVQRG